MPAKPKGNDAPDTPNINSNKVVRRDRKLGCNCSWDWVTGEDPTDLEPYHTPDPADPCPLHGTTPGMGA